ncbi:hypothetical protein [Bradyrhizobium sp. CCBAU 11445]|uniref:thiolase family protein n=1 Tax=Bradyrhizobium sp. CCBAU 11445 TaxID=1630896 RepID=UPI003FA428D2
MTTAPAGAIAVASDCAQQNKPPLSTTVTSGEGNLPATTLETLQALKPLIEGGSVTPGNASQLSDGASARVVVERSLAEKRGIHRSECTAASQFSDVLPKRLVSPRSTLFRSCGSAIV